MRPSPETDCAAPRATYWVWPVAEAACAGLRPAPWPVSHPCATGTRPSAYRRAYDRSGGSDAPHLHSGSRNKYTSSFRDPAPCWKSVWSRRSVLSFPLRLRLKNSLNLLSIGVLYCHENSSSSSCILAVTILCGLVLAAPVC